MKNIKMLLSILLCCLLAEAAHSQFAITPITFGACGRTTPLIEGVGIGNFPAGMPTAAALHINSFYTNNAAGFFSPGELFRTDCQSNVTNAWRMFTGLNAANTAERFAIFIPANTNRVFIQSTRGDLFFNTAGGGPVFSVQERMHITQSPGNQAGIAKQNATKVNISYGAGFAPITVPTAMLNLGFDPPQGPNGGQRAWMDVGTFMCASSDNMYVGLKNEAPSGDIGPNPPSQFNDRQDAVVNWGDNNASLNPYGPDRLRFIFTMVQNPPTATGAASANGLEVMRMAPQQNGTTIFTGIGGDPAVNLYGPAQNSTDPTQTLEVNSLGATNVAGGSSGLRFTNLNTTSPVIAVNPGPGVLAVNANGDVIYVQDNPGGFSLGNYCGSAQNPLTNDYEIPLNSNNFFFSGQATGRDNVAVGLNCASTPLGKLHVQRDYPGTSAYNNSTSVYALNNDISLPGANLGQAFGVFGEANNTNRTNAGGYFTASNGINNTGVIAFTNSLTSLGSNTGFDANVTGASNQNICFSGHIAGSIGTTNMGGAFTISSTVSTNIGVACSVTGATTNNIGGRFLATGNAPGNNIAILANAQNASGNNYAIAANGNILFNGQLSGSNNVMTSDQMFKTNIDSISNAISLLAQLQPHTYFMDTNNVYGMNFPAEKQYGLIAQQVELILPELVGQTTKPADYDSLGNILLPSVTYKTLNYNAFIAILIKGIQEQQLQLDSMSQAMNAMQSQINGCCSSARTANQDVNATDVHLSNDGSIVLNQNVPNPFAEQTTINYFLPENVVRAQMLFYDATGKLIKAVELEGKGKGQLNVFADDLSNGIYSYALVVDGQVIDTKRMVKTN